MTDYPRLIQECEQAIRMGKPSSAGKLLTAISVKTVPREFRLPLANLCRRVGLYPLGLRLLSRTVLSLEEGEDDSTPKERAEYGVLLLRSGAASEAIQILDAIKGTDAPDALLYRSFAHFHYWEFTEAAAKLTDYVSSNINLYERYIGRVNLTQALANSGLNREAMVMIDENLAVSEEQGFTRLKLYCHVQRAQVLIGMENFPEAEKELARAKRVLTSESALNALLVQKWTAVYDTLKTRRTEPVDNFQKIAWQKHDFDGYREMELHALKVRFDRERFHRLYFGTPFPRCREKICKELKQFPTINSYVLGNANSLRCLNLETGELGSDRLNIAGQKIHHLFDVLLRDLYCPLSIGGLFSELFPGEPFRGDPSADRVYQIIRRARQWATRTGHPLKIQEKSGFYTLIIGPEFSVKLPLVRKPVDVISLQLDRLKRNVPEASSFSAKEVSEKLEVSKRSAQRLMKWGVERKKIECVEASRTVSRYRFRDSA